MWYSSLQKSSPKKNPTECIGYQTVSNTTEGVSKSPVTLRCFNSGDANIPCRKCFIVI